ncbi:hypothetical protein L596_030477 [Steinernema carpocapsae]|uniref:Uncharacterized protein n=1 Tax=Steinernema carpocapsae TaxID=34508 RepID=A0A4U5LPI4_STECR|nr:hypothetical protein L596_030477 [Steinernema carpocapsae]
MLNPVDGPKLSSSLTHVSDASQNSQGRSHELASSGYVALVNDAFLGSEDMLGRDERSSAVALKDLIGVFFLDANIDKEGVVWVLSLSLRKLGKTDKAEKEKQEADLHDG